MPTFRLQSICALILNKFKYVGYGSSMYSEVQVEQVWTGVGVSVRWGPMNRGWLHEAPIENRHTDTYGLKHWKHCLPETSLVDSNKT